MLLQRDNETKPGIKFIVNISSVFLDQEQLIWIKLMHAVPIQSILLSASYIC